VAAEQLHILQTTAYQVPHAEPERADSPAYDLVGLLACVGVALRPRGADAFTGACPWHESSSGADLVVWPAQNWWKCWNPGCNRQGDAVRFVSLWYGVPPREAARRLGLPAPVRHHTARKARPRRTVTVGRVD
jgi:DNA primase